MQLNTILVNDEVSNREMKFHLAKELSEDLGGSTVLDLTHISEMYDDYEAGQVLKEQVRNAEKNSNYVIVIGPFEEPLGLTMFFGIDINIYDNDDSPAIELTGLLDNKEDFYSLGKEGDLSTISSDIAERVIKGMGLAI